MRKYVKRGIAILVSLAMVSILSVISVVAAACLLLVLGCVMFLKWARAGSGRFRGLAYAVAGVALIVGAWKYKLPHAGVVPPSCHDLGPAGGAGNSGIAPPGAADLTPVMAFRSRIEPQIVRLFRQIEDVKDATTLVAEARRIADYAPSDQASASLRDWAAKLEASLRSTNLLTQGDIETRASALRKNLDEWHGQLDKLASDADFRALERTFNDDVVRLSFDETHAALDDLQKAINEFALSQGLKAETQFAAHFEASSSTWVLEERERFVNAAVELIDIDASDVELARYENAPVPKVFFGTSNTPVAQLRSIPAPAGQAMELRLEYRLPAETEAICGATSGVGVVPFTAATLRWPRALDTLLRGHVRLQRAQMDSLPFTATIDRGRPIDRIGLPRYAFFQASAPVKLSEAYDEHGETQDAIEVVGGTVSPRSLAIEPIRFELAPGPLRNKWAFEYREYLFPLNLWLVGLYFLFSALVEEFSLAGTAGPKRE